MKRKLVVAAALAALFSVTAWAEWGPGYGGFMGPGMMGGQGPQFMQGYGYCGRGPGAAMMGGYGWGSYDALDLTDAQREKIAAIEKEEWNARWNAMKAMHDLRWTGTAKGSDPRQAFEAMTALRKQVFEANVDAQKRIDEVLTPEQKQQLRKASRAGW